MDDTPDNCHLCEDLSDRAVCQKCYATALRERDEARAALRIVAERQREACEKYAFCQACASAVGSAALVTEGEP